MGVEWFALVVPVLCCVIMLLLFRKKIVWWELALPTAVTAVVILLFKWAAFRYNIYDVEYRGSVIVSVRYYEYWETWVSQMCTRQVACGENCSTDANGNRTCTTVYCTEYYDCSYCDHNPAEWYAYDNYGNKYPISEAYYNELKARWKATPEFIELNRSISHHGGCGKDGDAYSIAWDGNPHSADAAVREHSYKNYVQGSHSAFKMPYVSDKEAKKLGLYKYPELYRPYKQPAILGLDSLKMAQSAKDSILALYEYFNGYYGSEKHVKMFILLFPDKPIGISFQQEYYWDGGNDNELVVVIGYDSRTNRLSWVRPFGWADEKRVFIDVREDIMEIGVLDFYRFYQPLGQDIEKYWKPKNFRDFNYLHVDLSTTQLIWLYILTTLVSVGVSIYCVKNQFEYDQRY
jgi:hypothetical protein